MPTLTKPKAIKDHFCDGPCKIKRIHKGTKYFVWKEQTYGRFYTTKKYHPWCLPDPLPTWIEKGTVFTQRVRNRRNNNRKRMANAARS